TRVTQVGRQADTVSACWLTLHRAHLRVSGRGSRWGCSSSRSPPLSWLSRSGWGGGGDVFADAAPVPSGLPNWLIAGLIVLLIAVVLGVVWLVRRSRRR